MRAGSDTPDCSGGVDRHLSAAVPREDREPRDGGGVADAAERPTGFGAHRSVAVLCQRGREWKGIVGCLGSEKRCHGGPLGRVLAFGADGEYRARCRQSGAADRGEHPIAVSPHSGVERA